MIDYADWQAAASDPTAPEFVKRAAFAGTRGKAPGYAADIVHDELPCDTPEETWVSARAFAVKAASGAYARVAGLEDSIRSRIKTAADLFGISADVETALSVKTAEAPGHADDDYGWVDGAGRKYPLFSAAHVKRACAYFEDNKYMYPFTMRSAIARRILAKAAAFDVPREEIPDGVRKTAGHGLARPDDVVNELVVRAESCDDVDVAGALAGAAEKVAELGMDALAHGGAEKLAELVEDADVITGRYKTYGRLTRPPEDFLFGIDIKTAEAAVSDMIEIGRDVLSLRKLAELPDELYDGVFGDGFAASCKTAGTLDPEKLGKAIAERRQEDVNELANVLRSL